jgi:hypothetical protein
MTSIVPGEAEKIVAAARVAQITALVKENQLITALVLFVLWQTGAILSAQQYVGGVMC